MQESQRSNTQFSRPWLEWEAIDFPIKINNLKLEQSEFLLPDSAVIEIIRNDDYRISAIFYGYLQNRDVLDHNKFIGEGNIVEGNVITGIDENGNNVSLSDTHFLNLHTSSIRTEEGYFYQSKLLIEKCIINYAQKGQESESQPSETHHLDWFIIANSKTRFKKKTIRKTKHPYKIRKGIDAYDESLDDPRAGYSGASDYFEIRTKDFRCLVAEVPDLYVNGNIQGICIEYREDWAKTFTVTQKDAVRQFISFLLGSPLIQVGYSKLSDTILIESMMVQPVTRVPRDYSAVAMPPIHFNYQYDWGNIEWLAGQLFDRYIELNEPLQLSQVISRFFFALKSPLGLNLPVMASAYEILASSYLKMTGHFNDRYMSDEAFQELIDQELSTIKEKFGSIEGAENMVRKISGANTRNPSEKINLFLSLAGVITGKTEKQAVALRNKMAHSARDYTVEDNIRNDLFLTRVYQVLFNRTILKLLGYAEFYIDYSLRDVRAKHIDLPAGETKAEREAGIKKSK